MKRKVFIKEFFARIALTFLLLCLIVYTVYHAIWNTSGSLLTTPTRKITDSQLLGGDAWLFRNETVLTVPQAGLVNGVAESGSKVGRNTLLTEVWTGTPEEELAGRQEQLNRLNHTVRLLTESLPPEGTPVSALDGYRSDAMDRLMQIRYAVRDQDWSKIPALEDEMRILLNRYGALTGTREEIAHALKEVQTERDALLTGERQTLYNTDSSGYYYDLSCVDGYESLFHSSALSNLTAESFENLKQSEPQAPENGYAAGKICYDYTWYLAVDFPDGAGELFEPDTLYRFRFPESGGMELTLTCEKILTGENGATVAVFRSEVTPSAFRFLRTQRVEITVGSCNGYYIPEQASAVLNGVPGVYIFEENTVRFRRVHVLYQGDGYLIADETDPEPEQKTAYLALNDLLITSGKNLYEGKVYQ